VSFLINSTVFYHGWALGAIHGVTSLPNFCPTTYFSDFAGLSAKPHPNDVIN
jgi:hypothetical protein